MMYTHVAAAILSAMLAFTGAWQIQNWRFDAKELQRAEQTIADTQAAFRASERNQIAVSTAQNAAASRVVVLRRDADRARDELDSLRAQSAAAMRTAASSLDACLDRARTFDSVLGQCAATYQELGATADRYVSDIKTLSEGWPK